MNKLFSKQQNTITWIAAILLGVCLALKYLILPKLQDNTSPAGDQKKAEYIPQGVGNAAVSVAKQQTKSLTSNLLSAALNTIAKPLGIAKVAAAPAKQRVTTVGSVASNIPKLTPVGVVASKPTGLGGILAGIASSVK